MNTYNLGNLTKGGLDTLKTAEKLVRSNMSKQEKMSFYKGMMILK